MDDLDIYFLAPVLLFQVSVISRLLSTRFAHYLRQHKLCIQVQNLVAILCRINASYGGLLASLVLFDLLTSELPSTRTITPLNSPCSKPKQSITAEKRQAAVDTALKQYHQYRTIGAFNWYLTD